MADSWISELRDILTHLLEKSWLPFPIEAGICESWKQGLESDQESGTVLYTSCMYHLAPVIEKAVESLEKFGVTKGGLRSRLAGVVARTAGQLLVRPDQSEIQRANEIIKKIYGFLRRRGIRIRLLKKEIYSGVLLYELGLEKDFAEYAQRVAKFFKEAGVREIITVDPHTHYILEKVYPRYVPGFDVKVLSYLDLIDGGGAAIKNFAVHDSCLYARFLGRYDVVRKLLSPGQPVEHPYYTARDTSGCCGGPAESLFPDVARKVAQVRVKDLAKLSKDVVVQCPICYVNLKRASNGEVRLYHLPEVLV